MPSDQILMQRRAVALEEAFEILETLSPTNEVLAETKDLLTAPEYDVVILVAELARICYQQREHITELGQRIEALEAGPTK